MSPVPLVDQHQRRISYLRLSVTPYCDFRCGYCQPDGPVLPAGSRDELSPEEIARLVALFARLGVSKVRLSGGEPTLRRDLVEVVAAIAATPGIEDLSLSTHAMRLAPLVGELAAAGLKRVNVSLDTLDPERFRRIAGRHGLDRVLASIRAAREAGLTPIKLNVVPMRGVNDDEIGALLDFAAKEALELRFIELMPLGVVRKAYAARHLDGRTLLALFGAHGHWRELPRRTAAGPARRYRRDSDGLTVGLIDPMSPDFCGRCNRLRITHRGELRSCLFGRADLSLRPLLSRSDWESAGERVLREAILYKPERHRLEQGDDGELWSLARVGG